jgi:hypothetical protein
MTNGASVARIERRRNVPPESVDPDRIEAKFKKVAHADAAEQRRADQRSLIRRPSSGPSNRLAAGYAFG